MFALSAVGGRQRLDLPEQTEVFRLSFVATADSLVHDNRDAARSLNFRRRSRFYVTLAEYLRSERPSQAQSQRSCFADAHSEHTAPGRSTLTLKDASAAGPPPEPRFHAVH